MSWLAITPYSMVASMVLGFRGHYGDRMHVGVVEAAAGNTLPRIASVGAAPQPIHLNAHPNVPVVVRVNDDGRWPRNADIFTLIREIVADHVP